MKWERESIREPYRNRTRETLLFLRTDTRSCHEIYTAVWDTDDFKDEHSNGTAVSSAGEDISAGLSYNKE